jgi:hypothetical protein
MGQMRADFQPASVLARDADGMASAQDSGSCGVKGREGKNIMPKRIRRKRTRGWKMPPNCVSVTRPGKWGNLFLEIANQ